MKKRILASLMALCLIVGLLPTAVLAVDEETGSDSALLCTCEALCAEGAVDGTCPVCAVDDTACAYTAPVEPEDGSAEERTEKPAEESEGPACGGLEGCAGDTHAEGCPLYVAPAEPEIPLTDLIPAEPVEKPAAAEEAEAAAAPESAVTGELDLVDGSIVITADGYRQGNEEILYDGTYTITQTSANTAVQNNITVVDGKHTITLDGVNIDVSGLADPTLETACAFAILGGDVTLVLADGTHNTLKSGLVSDGVANNTVSFAGLWVKEGAYLTIQGEGMLTAEGGPAPASCNNSTGAGIGACGGGHRTASQNKDYYTAGDITIENGTVIATGSKNGRYGGPGIGGGWNDSSITITGGDVTAKSGVNTVGCAGIGGGYGYTSGKKTITISGGKVTATGGSAGIGGGAYAGNYAITISSGEVTAESKGTGAGIGHGGGGYSKNDFGTITITGGTVTAIGSAYAAGIGGAGVAKVTVKDFCAGNSGTITISGGTVNANGGRHGPGIGSGGYETQGSNITIAPNSGMMDTITITGGTVKAVNGADYPGTGDAAGTEYQINGTSTGIGQGKQAGDDAKNAFKTWALQTDNGNALKLETASGTLKRNGKAFRPGQLVSDSETYLVLPEGYYEGLDSTGVGTLITADAEEKAKADTLKADLEKIDLTGSGDALTAQIQKLQECEKTYAALSETLQCYVDAEVDKDHTLTELKKQLENKKIEVTVTLDAKGGEPETQTATAIYNQISSFPVPTRANYTFVGWYLDDTKITDEKGKGLVAWPTIASDTLTARWKSEILGDGTENAPYQLKSASNFVALSHILAGIGTDEEFELFGKNPTDRNALRSSCYELTDDVELSTADGFYGIGFASILHQKNDTQPSDTWDSNCSFDGTFDGKDHTITLDIDTSKRISTPANKTDSTNGKIELGTDAQGRTLYAEVSGGVFGKAGDNAVIQNITTVGTVTLVTNSAPCAVLVGVTGEDVTIAGCTNRADLKTGATYNASGAAAFVGTGARTLTITNCTNYGDMAAGQAIQLSDNSTTPSLGNAIVGGMVSMISQGPATFENCINYGPITATRNTEEVGRTAWAGGLVGYVGEATAKFKNCQNHGPVQAAAESNNFAGGIVGSVIEESKLNFQSCENYAQVEAQHGGTAGMILSSNGKWGHEVFNNCFHVMKAQTGTDGWKLTDDTAKVQDGSLRVPVTSEQQNYYDDTRYVVTGDGKKAADLFSIDGTVLYNDLTHNESIPDDALPYQSWENAFLIRSQEDHTNLVKAIEGDADAQKAVLGTAMSSASVAAKSVALAKAYVKLGTDLKLTGDSVIGLGSDETPFSGKIDGQRHTVTFDISSSQWTAQQPNRIGLIGHAKGAEVKHVRFQGKIDIATDPTNGKTLYIGPAAAHGEAVVISDCTSAVSVQVTHNSTVANATGSYVYAGGLAGHQTGATVRGCTYEGEISVTAPKYAEAGGIGASLTNSTVSDCTVKGNIQAVLRYNSNLPVFGEESAAGGIAGEMSGTATNCTVVGTVYASNDAPQNYGACAGGIVGTCTGALTVKDCGAFTTVKAVRTGHGTTDETYRKPGALAGNNADQLTVNGTNWAVMTAGLPEVSGVCLLDTRVLTNGTFGDSKVLSRDALPAGSTIQSSIAELNADGTVSYIKAGTGTISLAYDGQVFYTSETLTVEAKELKDNDVTITGISSSYPSDKAAQDALAAIEVVHEGHTLVKGTDYTVTCHTDTCTFTIAFTGNYSGTVSRKYTVTADAPIVTVKDHSGVYDAAAHSISVSAPEGATVTYGVNANSLSAINPSYTNVGTYVVYWKVVSGGQSVTGAAVVEITPAQLIVKADDQSIPVGDALPTSYSYTVSGWQGNDGDDANDLLTGVTVSCSAADSSKEGAYDITVSGPASIDNYEITYEKGILTVFRRSSGGGSSSGSSSGDHTVSVDAGKHGAVTVSPKRSDKGDTVTITVKPDKGYELDELTVTDKHGNTVKLKDKGNGKFTFTMPGSKVTVEASFKQIDAEPEISAFTDVPADAYYADAVAWAVKEGITSGTSAATFTPNASCTRAQMVTFLWRANGSPVVNDTMFFTDVPADAYYAEAVRWAVSEGITTGTTATTFNPNATVTRAQAVTFIYRNVQAQGGGFTGSWMFPCPFTDVPADAYYFESVQWCAMKNITSGTSADTFSPNAPCTRAQIVTFLYRETQ